MSRAGTVYDLGYVPHEGERLGRAGAMKAIVKDGVKRALGIGRKSRAKVFPWLLIAAAIVPATVIVFLSFFISNFNLPIGNPFASHAGYFDVIGSLSLLFVAFVTPTLLVPDRRNGTLEIYASRPVRASDYLTARAIALGILASLYILVPQTTLYIGLAGLDEGGLWAGLIGKAGEIPYILGSTLGFVIGYGAPAFLVSAFLSRQITASGVFLVGMMMSGGLVEAIPRGGEYASLKYLGLLSMIQNPMAARDWFFDQPSRTTLNSLGVPPWMSLAALVGFALLTVILAHRRYRKAL